MRYHTAMLDFSKKTVIFANGAVPEHAVPLMVLREAERIICCDGAVDKLVPLGYVPDLIVGDMDSISDSARERFKDRIVEIPDQGRNDLTKALKLCLQHGWHDIVVIGATGRRVDHTLGNLSLLVDFARQLDLVLLDDNGTFFPLLDSGGFVTEAGQQISIFSFDPEAAISSQGLKYPLNGIKLNRWWQATLNEAQATLVQLRFDGGPLLVFRSYL